MGQKVQQRAFTNTFEGKNMLDKNVPALYNNFFQQIVVIFSFYHHNHNITTNRKVTNLNLSFFCLIGAKLALSLLYVFCKN